MAGERVVGAEARPNTCSPMGKPRSDYRPLTKPASPGDIVALGCPLCEWRSEPMVVEDQPNGTWHALFGVGGLGGVGDMYRTHFAREHRPPPLCLVRAALTAAHPQATRWHGNVTCPIGMLDTE